MVDFWMQDCLAFLDPVGGGRRKGRSGRPEEGEEEGERKEEVGSRKITGSPDRKAENARLRAPPGEKKKDLTQ